MQVRRWVKPLDECKRSKESRYTWLNQKSRLGKAPGGDMMRHLFTRAIQTRICPNSNVLVQVRKDEPFRKELWSGSGHRAVEFMKRLNASPKHRGGHEVTMECTRNVTEDCSSTGGQGNVCEAETTK
ncbi:unnamed protein product [Schistocephalus solidus]|uniref:Uncharacterized protein n=1 Tax=Schistocephalus solidus TaxID=70667 RepID=A0A183TKE3_SCHSO|nr:unnamed protein product [Schistocephalus solidus]